MSGTKFDDQMSRKVEALCSTRDAVAQRKQVLDAWFAEKRAADYSLLTTLDVSKASLLLAHQFGDSRIDLCGKWKQVFGSYL